MTNGRSFPDTQSPSSVSYDGALGAPGTRFVVVLSTTCAHCLRAIRWMNRWVDEPGMPPIVGVVRASAEDRDGLLAGALVRFTVIADPAERIVPRYGTVGTPELVVVSSEGLVYERFDFVSRGELDALCRRYQLLPESDTETDQPSAEGVVDAADLLQTDGGGRRLVLAETFDGHARGRISDAALLPLLTELADAARHEVAVATPSQDPGGTEVVH